ncbi:hypothetical protein HYT23_06280 [Candidatus Pacearchaeota archaeon]|nr:hypothetical protein [Candidatus Pacearchaeota archaeon]
MKEETITIDADITREKALNREMNPREIVYGEATNTINPLTGRSYEDQFMIQAELERFMESYARVNSSCGKKIDKVYLDKRNYYEDLEEMLLPRNLSLIEGGRKFKSPSTIPTIELQKALGRMEVREGRITEREYMEFVEDVDVLSKKYSETPGLTLESITSVDGLNSALCVLNFNKKEVLEKMRFILITSRLFSTPLFLRLLKI